jgi:hypothetical protein
MKLSVRRNVVPGVCYVNRLVHLAGELGTGEILTLDSDFHVYRWNRSRPFHLLVDLRG